MRAPTRETAKILLLMGALSIGHVPVSILGVKAVLKILQDATTRGTGY